MIIGLAGRISSGKRVLCNVLEKHGYKRIYFALPLKKLLTELLCLPNIERLDDLKNEEKDYVFTDKDYQYIAQQSDIPLDFIKEKMEHVKFTTVRQMLQYIGTDVFRAYDSNWHVKHVHKMMKPYQNYVIDDLRFPNEKEFIEALHGDCWYICRPKIDNVINHSSETSLSWHDFEYNIIINDKGLDSLVFKWDTFVSNYQDHMAHRLAMIEMLKQKQMDVNTLADPFLTLDMFMLHKDIFRYTDKKWDKAKINSYSIDTLNNLIIKYNDETIEYVSNKLNIEDFKLLI